jgi:hypothetical protein
MYTHAIVYHLNGNIMHTPITSGFYYLPRRRNAGVTFRSLVDLHARASGRQFMPGLDAPVQEEGLV